MKQDKYLQVDPDFYEVIDAVAKKDKTFKIFYFDQSATVQDVKGSTIELLRDVDGEFLALENGRVRLDRIITINGKVGPSYEAYDAFANACFSCQAGYDD